MSELDHFSGGSGDGRGEGNGVNQPSEEMLIDYASGALDAASALVVAAHLALNEGSRRGVRAMEEVGGALLETIEPAPMSAGALDDLFARIDAEEEEAAPAPVSDEFDILPEPVRDQARAALARDKWRFAGPGVRRLDLGFDGDGRGHVELFRIEPGYGVPTHTHEGREITLVLTGAFKDERGTYEPGDICFASPDVTHRPVALPGTTCYALAVTDAPITLTGALGIIQKALR